MCFVKNVVFLERRFVLVIKHFVFSRRHFLGASYEYVNFTFPQRGVN